MNTLTLTNYNVQEISCTEEISLDGGHGGSYPHHHNLVRPNSWSVQMIKAAVDWLFDDDKDPVGQYHDAMKSSNYGGIR